MAEQPLTTSIKPRVEEMLGFVHGFMSDDEVGQFVDVHSVTVSRWRSSAVASQPRGEALSDISKLHAFGQFVLEHTQAQTTTDLKLHVHNCYIDPETLEPVPYVDEIVKTKTFSRAIRAAFEFFGPSISTTSEETVCQP